MDKLLDRSTPQFGTIKKSQLGCFVAPSFIVIPIIWGMNGACMGHVWGMYGACMGHVWTVGANC